MNYITYLLFRLIVFKISILPFRCMYILSDFLAFFLNNIFKYRKKVIFNNLRRCFPEKTPDEHKKIADGFYKNLADMILEAIKGFSMSEKELLKRYVFTQKEILNNYYASGRHVICAGGHYYNWEWGVLIIGSQFENKPFGIYKPVKNKYIDSYIASRRTKINMNLLTMEDTVKGMRAQHEKPAYFVLIADQSPSSHKKAIWVDFFGIKTACLPGTEIASRLFNCAVVYLVPRRIKRGYYICEAKILCDQPSETQKGEITQKLMAELEKDIRKEPSAWLWSHRRWKHKYEEIMGSEV